MLKKDKPVELEKVKKLVQGYSTVCILDMHKMPAGSLQKIREALRGTAAIRMAKKVLIKKALESLEMNEIKKRLDSINDKEIALLLANENPFRIFRVLKENRTSAPARTGDTAPADIIIAKGTTELPPGPAISTLQKLGLKTSVQQGKIFVMQEKTAVKAGEKITDDMVNAFNLLKMEPMEIGLEIVFAWDGAMYEKSVLDIDVEDYRNRLLSAMQEAMNVAVNAGYPTEESIGIMIQKSFAEARELCMHSGIISKEFIEYVLIKAIREASLLKVE